MSLTLTRGNGDPITGFITVPHQIAGVVPPVISMAAHAARFTFLPFLNTPHTFFSTPVFTPILIFVLPTVLFSSSVGFHSCRALLPLGWRLPA